MKHPEFTWCFLHPGSQPKDWLLRAGRSEDFHVCGSLTRGDEQVPMFLRPGHQVGKCGAKSNGWEGLSLLCPALPGPGEVILALV